MTFVAISSAGASFSKTASTPNTPFSIGYTGTIINAGELIVAIVSTDNLSTVSGPTNEHLVLTVGAFAMSKQREMCYSAGSAGNGSTCSIWTLVPNEDIASSSAVSLTSPSAIAAKTYSIYRFSKDAFTAIDVAPGITEQTDIASDPGALTIDTGISGRQHLFIRGMAGQGYGTSFNAGGGMSGFGTAQTSGGANDTNIMVRGAYQYSGTLQSLATDPTAPAGDWVSIGLALYERSTGAATPVSTVIDDFNRADGLFTAGAVWTGTAFRDTSITNLGVTSNVAAKRVNTNWDEIQGVATYGPDIDLAFDIVTMPVSGSKVRLIAAVANPQSASFTGAFVELTPAGGMSIGEYTSGSFTAAYASSTTGLVVAGDSVWLALRGRMTYALFSKSGSGVWNRAVSYASLISPARINFLPRAGRIALYLDGGMGATKIDNLRGGTVTPTAGAKSNIII